MSFLTSLQEDIRAIETAVEKVNVSSVKEGISAIETTVQTLVEKQERTDKKVGDVGDDVSVVNQDVHTVLEKQKNTDKKLSEVTEKLDRLERTLTTVLQYLESSAPNLKRTEADIWKAVELWNNDKAAAVLLYGHPLKWDMSAVPHTLADYGVRL